MSPQTPNSPEFGPSQHLSDDRHGGELHWIVRIEAQRQKTYQKTDKSINFVKRKAGVTDAVAHTGGC